MQSRPPARTSAPAPRRPLRAGPPGRKSPGPFPGPAVPGSGCGSPRTRRQSRRGAGRGYGSAPDPICCTKSPLGSGTPGTSSKRRPSPHWTRGTPGQTFDSNPGPAPGYSPPAHSSHERRPPSAGPPHGRPHSRWTLPRGKPPPSHKRSPGAGLRPTAPATAVCPAGRAPPAACARGSGRDRGPAGAPCPGWPWSGAPRQLPSPRRRQHGAGLIAPVQQPDIGGQLPGQLPLARHYVQGHVVLPGIQMAEKLQQRKLSPAAAHRIDHKQDPLHPGAPPLQCLPPPRSGPAPPGPPPCGAAA